MGLGNIVQKLDEGSRCTVLLADALARQLTDLEAGTTSNVINLIDESKVLRAKIDAHREYLENHPPGVGVEKDNRLDIRELGHLERQLVAVHSRISNIALREDPLFDGDSDPIELATGGLLRDRLGRSTREDLIRELRDLNSSMHKFVCLVYSQYPHVTGHGGVQRLGRTDLLEYLNSYDSIDQYAKFCPIETLRQLHARGWVEVENIDSTSTSLEFKFKGHYFPMGRTIEGSTPPKGSLELQVLAISAMNSAGTYAMLNGLVPEAAGPVASGLVILGWAISSFKQTSLKYAFTSRFDVLLARETQGNPTQPEDLLARILVGIHAIKGVALRCPSVEPAATLKDKYTERAVSSHVLLTSQLITALKRTIERFDELADKDATRAKSARAPVEEAVGEVVKMKGALWRYWGANSFLSSLPTTIAGPFCGLFPMMSYIGRLFF
jgi:hypothetical protein